ncbi:MAG: Bud site selection protein 20 [Geoglossum umbratile]|nr:MAG: Bud site selection protein 20 [Geoglossum umbratile]
MAPTSAVLKQHRHQLQPPFLLGHGLDQTLQDQASNKVRATQNAQLGSRPGAVHVGVMSVATATGRHVWQQFLTHPTPRRDLDQIHADLRSARHLGQYKETKVAEDLPGLGQYYCVECAKWFESEHNLVRHRRGKNHLRRVRLLREAPYSQREAEAAVGLGVDNGLVTKAAVDTADEAMPDAGREMEVGGGEADGVE